MRGAYSATLLTGDPAQKDQKKRRRTIHIAPIRKRALAPRKRRLGAGGGGI